MCSIRKKDLQQIYIYRKEGWNQQGCACAIICLGDGDGTLSCSFRLPCFYHHQRLVCVFLCYPYSVIAMYIHQNHYIYFI